MFSAAEPKQMGTECSECLRRKSHFTSGEIKLTLLDLDNMKAKGPNGIGKDLSVELAPSRIISLARLFNTITNKQAYPSAWKTSEMVPIFIDGDRQAVSNYRPISNLLFFRKLMRNYYWTISSKSSHCSPLINNIDSKKRSTTTNLINHLHDVFVKLDNVD